LGWSRRWEKEILFELRWHLFLEREPKKHLGQDPLSQIALFFCMTLGLTFMIVTGWALYAQGAGQGSSPDTFFG
jgi:Ni/Fe-hydrogenase 1 B-type cytochrome subunit